MRIAAIVFCLPCAALWAQAPAPVSAEVGETTQAESEPKDAQAMSARGGYYMVHRNDDPAFPGLMIKWYSKAADAGDGTAMMSLWQIYERGIGVPKDPAKAAEWKERATQYAKQKRAAKAAAAKVEATTTPAAEAGAKPARPIQSFIPGGREEGYRCTLQQPVTLDLLGQVAVSPAGRSAAVALCKGRDVVFPVNQASLDLLKGMGFGPEDLKTILMATVRTQVFRRMAVHIKDQLNQPEAQAVLDNAGVELSLFNTEDVLRKARTQDYCFGISTGNALGDSFSTVAQSAVSPSSPVLEALWVKGSVLVKAAKEKPFTFAGEDLTDFLKGSGAELKLPEASKSSFLEMASRLLPVPDTYLTALNASPSAVVRKGTPTSFRFRSESSLEDTIICAYPLDPRHDKAIAPKAFGWFSNKEPYGIRGGLMGFADRGKIWGDLHMIVRDFGELPVGDHLIALVPSHRPDAPIQGFILRVTDKPLEASPYEPGEGW